MVLLLNNELKEGLPAGVFSAMETICSRALAEHGWPQTAEISLTICDNLRIQALNKEWRGVDAATDVLSFPLITPDEDLTAAEDFLLGDIIISLERAKEQAADYNHSLEREVLYLFTHGLLHLLGYDHEEETAQQAMRLAEEKLLQAVGATRDEI
ncbi:MAG: rRNA maturation RNase YbeY [Dethiobacteraceae bacterium]|jgi:probable rRNA maturation factor|nr:rRNA maturation RNase YbeY [Bacillota bacterium]